MIKLQFDSHLLLAVAEISLPLMLLLLHKLNQCCPIVAFNLIINDSVCDNVEALPVLQPIQIVPGDLAMCFVCARASE